MASAESYLVLSAILFCIGLYGVLTRKSAITIYMSLEIMFNAANINFVVFSQQLQDLSGQLFALLIIGVSAAEFAAGLAIIVLLYRSLGTTDVDEVHLMQG
jgi:NADH-quinone oxidoreductase subunit K